MRWISGPFALLLASRLLSAVSQAIIIAMVARWTDPVRFGTVVAALGIATAVSGLSDLGFTSYIIRARARNKNDSKVAYALWISDLIAIPTALLCAGAIVVAAVVLHQPALLVMLPLAVWVALEKCTEVWLAVAIADEYLHCNIFSVAARRGLACCLFLLLSTLLADTVLALTSAYALSSIIGYLATLGMLRGRVSHRGRWTFRSIISEAVPYWLNSVCGQARGLDVSLVGVMAGPVAAALYGVPARLLGPLKLLPGALGSVLTVRAGRQVEPNFTPLRTAFLAVGSIYGLFMGGLAIFAQELITVLLGREYLTAVEPMQIFCLAAFTSGIAAMLVGLLQGWGDERFVGRSALVATVLLLVAAVVGALAGGAVGASIGVSLAYLINLLILSVRCMHRSLRRRVESAVGI